MPRGKKNGVGGIGHNSEAGGIEGDRLTSFIERIERVQEEIDALSSDKREIFTEAKGAGFDTKIMREIIRERKMDAAERQKREILLDLYRNALGMLADTPLGQAAINEAAATH